MTILDDIIKYKRVEELPRQKQLRAVAQVRAEAALAEKTLDFVTALKARPNVALIAEVKRASPSKGLLRPNFDALDLATTYALNGAAAISVLTDSRYFQGKLAYLTQIRNELQAAMRHRRPVILRKDFIFDLLSGL